MENSSYGQLRQDIGGLKASVESVDETLARHTESDKENFYKIDNRLTFIEKMMWITTGAVGIIGVGTLSQLFKDFLLR